MLRIKDLREDKDLLQKDVAKFLNISQTNYSKYELGKINIPINTTGFVISKLNSKSGFNILISSI